MKGRIYFLPLGPYAPLATLSFLIVLLVKVASLVPPGATIVFSAKHKRHLNPMVQLSKCPMPTQGFKTATTFIPTTDPFSSKRPLHPLTKCLAEEERANYIFSSSTSKALATTSKLWLNSWKEMEIRELELFPMCFEEELGLVPGTSFLLNLVPPDAQNFHKIMKLNGAPVVGIALLHSLEDSPFSEYEQRQYEEAQSSGDNGDFSIRPIALIGTVNSLVPAMGGLTPVKIIGRLRVVDVSHIDDCIRAKVHIYNDIQKDNHPNVTSHAFQILSKLVNRCNALEQKLLTATGITDKAKLCSNRMTLSKKVDEAFEESELSHESLLTFLTFSSMEHHFDSISHYWALEQTDAEERLKFVIRGLERRAAELEYELQLQSKI